MTQNVVKLRDRGIVIDLILSSDCYIEVNGIGVFGKTPNNRPLTHKLVKRETHESVGKGSKAYLDAEEYVTKFESKFDSDFLEKFWNPVMKHMHFMNTVFMADYLKTLPNKPVGAVVQSTKKFLRSGFAEENGQNTPAIRNMFSAYMENCDKFYKEETHITTLTKKTEPKSWLERAKEVNK